MACLTKFGVRNNSEQQHGLKKKKMGGGGVGKCINTTIILPRKFSHCYFLLGK